MKIINYIVLSLFVSYHPIVNAQNLFPQKDTVFIDTEVPRIDITISNSYLNTILAPGNEESNVEYPATFTYTSSISLNPQVKNY